MLDMSDTKVTCVTQISTRDDFIGMNKDASKEGKVAILIVYQKSSKPSLSIFPVFESYAKQHPENAVYYKLDAIDLSDLTDRIRGITNFPTFLAFRHGRKIGELVGAHVPKLRKFIETYGIPTPRRNINPSEYLPHPSLGNETLFNCPCQQRSGRNLVVCIDGTSNQFGENNTNVVELYHLLQKDNRQLTYYDSGIGTYAKPTFRPFSPSHWRRAIANKVDMAIAWRFEDIILRAYRWLAENYDEGDSIFLFGFSRGAYQVRALSAMIYTVGLIHKGNEAQIPFAYKLYSSVEDSSYLDDMILRMQQSIGTVQRPRSGEHFPDSHAKSRFMADNFKATFSRTVQVHFVGAWDTVSSVGVVRSKTLPFTARGMNHVCYFRHGLALDERRVKFLPEYAYGGVSKLEPPNQTSERVLETPRDENFLTVPPAERHPDVPPLVERPSESHTKEVWFAGSHSDIGGGNVSNMQLNRSQPALRWMSYEAVKAGLFMHSFKGYWALESTPKIHESLKHVWWFFELFVPVRQLSYKSQDGTIRTFHRGKGRHIQPGQMIHDSVFKVMDKSEPKYLPRANLPLQDKRPNQKAWEDFEHEVSEEAKKQGRNKAKPGSDFPPLEEDVLGMVDYLAEQCKRCEDSDSSELKRIRRALKAFMATEEAGRAMHEAADVSKTFIDFYARLPPKSTSSIPIHIVDDIRLLPPVLHARQKTAIDVHFVKKADDAMLLLEPIVSVGSEFAPSGDRGTDELDHVQLRYRKAAAPDSRVDRNLDIILKNVLEELGLERHYSTFDGFIVCRMAFGSERNLDKL